MSNAEKTNKPKKQDEKHNDDYAPVELDRIEAQKKLKKSKNG